MTKRRARIGLAAILAASLGDAAQGPAGRTTDDPDFLRGVDQVRNGDFSAAVVSLDAAIQRLGREPQRPKDLALAYVYQGVAYLEMEEEGLAKEKFRQALRRDGSLRLDPREFSAQQIRIFELVLGELKVVSSPMPSPKPKGGAAKTFAIVGGGAIVAGGIAVAARGGDTPTTTTTTTSTLSAAECANATTQWVTPADRATVSGTVNLVCSLPTGFNCAGLTVDFQRCNGNCIGLNPVPFIPLGNATATPPTYSLAWNSTTVSNGQQTLFCLARIFGGTGRGGIRLVEVRN